MKAIILITLSFLLGWSSVGYAQCSSGSCFVPQYRYSYYSQPIVVRTIRQPQKAKPVQQLKTGNLDALILRVEKLEKQNEEILAILNRLKINKEISSPYASFSPEVISVVDPIGGVLLK